MEDERDIIIEEQTKKPESDPIDVVLTIDIGAINTRVSLFDRSGDRYHFTGTASARTVYSDGGEIEYQSISGAVRKLESALDRHFLDDNDRIITPQKLGMIGADQVVVTWSGGESPRVVLMGLTEGSSIRAMEELLSTNGLKPAAKVCAMEGDALTQNISTVTAADPDIVVVSGGTEGGAEQALYRLGEILLLAVKSIDEKSRPEILFLGNASAADQFEKVFHRQTEIIFADNILGSESQQVSPSTAFQHCMLNFGKARNPALEQLQQETGCEALSGDFAYGRCVRLLSRINRANCSALGVEIGANRTIAAFGTNLGLDMNVSNAGIGRTLPLLLDTADASEILPWVSFQLKEDELRDYIMNKSVRPELIPANIYSAEIEQTLARFLIRKALADNPARSLLNKGAVGMVLLGGAVMRNVEDPGDALRIGMDSIRALGITDYYLDMNGLASAVGALAGVNRELAAQVTTPSMFLNLGRVITPLSTLKEGKRAFSVTIRDDSGNLKKYDIVQGGIKRIPLEYGRYYEMDWFNVSKGVGIPGMSSWNPVGFKSGCFGLVFDMRDEVLTLPKERSAQIHLLQRWKSELGSWREHDE